MNRLSICIINVKYKVHIKKCLKDLNDLRLRPGCGQQMSVQDKSCH